jgi:hypothetical protein
MVVSREAICKRVDRYRELTRLWMHDRLAQPGRERKDPRHAPSGFLRHVLGVSHAGPRVRQNIVSH